MMQFEKLRRCNRGVNPYHDEILAYLEAEAWVRFMASLLTDVACGVNAAASKADQGLEEFRKRFMYGNHPEDKENRCRQR